MAKDIFAILDELEEIVDRGTKIPMTGKVLVDDSEIFELIDKLRALIPEEVRNANWVLNERQRILDEAEAEAKRMVEHGKDYVNKIAGEDEVAKQAQAYAEEIVRKAQAYAREVKIGSVQYANELLQKVEGEIYDTVQALRRNREELLTMAKNDEKGTAEKGE